MDVVQLKLVQDELKPMSLGNFISRYEISKKQIKEGNLITLKDAKKYFRDKKSLQK